VGKSIARYDKKVFLLHFKENIERAFRFTKFETPSVFSAKKINKMPFLQRQNNNKIS
jgi:hypothetical protein